MYCKSPPVLSFANQCDKDEHAVDPQFEDIRFGAGLSPVIRAACVRRANAEQLKSPEPSRQRSPVETFETLQDRWPEAVRLGKTARVNRGSPAGAWTQEGAALLNPARPVWRRCMARPEPLQPLDMGTERPLRRGLAHFWADHFTADRRSRRVRAPATTLSGRADPSALVGPVPRTCAGPTVFHPADESIHLEQEPLDRACVTARV